LHTLSVEFIKHEGGFEEKITLESTLRIFSVTGPIKLFLLNWFYICLWVFCWEFWNRQFFW